MLPHSFFLFWPSPSYKFPWFARQWLNLVGASSRRVGLPRHQPPFKISLQLLGVFSTSFQPTRIQLHKGVSTAYIPVRRYPPLRRCPPPDSLYIALAEHQSRCQRSPMHLYHLSRSVAGGDQSILRAGQGSELISALFRVSRTLWSALAPSRALNSHLPD